MVDIVASNVDGATMRRLKDRANAKGVSVNDIAREALIAYVKPSKDELWAEADRLRKKIGMVSGDSTAIIRAHRDNKEPYR